VPKLESQVRDNRPFEDGTRAFEQLTGVKSFEQALMLATFIDRR
jgi:hypothetical protein